MEKGTKFLISLSGVDSYIINHTHNMTYIVLVAQSPLQIAFTSFACKYKKCVSTYLNHESVVPSTLKLVCPCTQYHHDGETCTSDNHYKINVESVEISLYKLNFTAYTAEQFGL